MTDTKFKVVESTPGDNRPADDCDGINSENLRRVIERIERKEEEKDGILCDIRAIHAEAKSIGFDPKIVRMVVRLRSMEPHQIEEEETLTDLYKRALGME
ncbi:MAG: DUF2312 domain-containing protein [Magnetococcales bacterium]|nr:DUF2312 domain-containing protein [Magnetococcales bacterium]